MTECNCDSANPKMGPWHAIGCCRLYEVCTCQTVVTSSDRVKQQVNPTCPLHATYTAAEVKVLTETASMVALELGREESRAELDALRALWWFIQDDFGVCDNGHGASITWAEANRLDELHDAVEVLYQEGGYPPRPSSLAPGATSDASSGVPGHPEVSEAVRSPQEPCECSCYKHSRLLSLLRHRPDCPNATEGSTP